jgi:hypothetical protein
MPAQWIHETEMEATLAPVLKCMVIALKKISKTFMYVTFL